MYKRTLATFTAFLVTAGAASADCRWGQVEYHLEWADEVSRGHALLGNPTMAVASGRDRRGGQHYDNITLAFSGMAERFTLDSPRTLSQHAEYDSHLELRQQLKYHDEFTVLEILFPRPVEGLSFQVSDFDEDRSFSGGYSDRLRIEGKEPVDDWTVLPVAGPIGISTARNSARRTHLYGLGLAEEIEMHPIKSTRPGGPGYENLSVRFDSPVTRVRIEFTSDLEAFSNEQFTLTPDPQRIVFSNLTYCAAPAD